MKQNLLLSLTLRACHLFIGKFDLFTLGYITITRVTQSWFLLFSLTWLLIIVISVDFSSFDRDRAY